MAQPEPTRAPGSLLGYQYTEWLFLLLVMFLPLLAAVLRHVFFRHRESAIVVLGWALLYMVIGFILWLVLMLIISNCMSARKNGSGVKGGGKLDQRGGVK